MKSLALGTRDHAIVIGGSIGGLLAARVLADHCRTVTVLERDRFPAPGENRRGVPQGQHTHGLLASGCRVMERWLPGLSKDLIDDGAVPSDIVAESRWFMEGACLARFTSGLDGLLMSRPFLEARVRRRVLALPNIKARQEFQVEGLMTSRDGQTVTGVHGRMLTGVRGLGLAHEQRLRRGQGFGREHERGTEIPADLVVDATGRGSRSPQWLEALGYPRPREERVEIALAYTTRFFRRRPEDVDGDAAVVMPPTSTGKRGGVMLAQEGNRWTVTLIGHFGQVAPPELDGFVEYARTLPAPYIYDVIKEAEPLGDGFSTRFPASQRRRYEQLKAFPEGLLAFGDAISSFNPIYGQGMSVAALESVELAAVLNEAGPAGRGLWHRFFKRAAKVVDMPWSISVGNDLRMPETIGPRSAMVSFINWYMSKLHRAAHTDETAAMAFFQTANLLAPPPSVLRPKVVWHVIASHLRSRRRWPEPVAEAQA